MFEDADVEIRAWAAGQFIGFDPEWASAAFSGIYEDLPTVEVLALRKRARKHPPKKPAFSDMSVESLVARFEDAATREYATRFVATDLTDRSLHNRIVGEVVHIMRELKRRDALARLVPFLESPNITVRHEAALACLAVAPAKASAVLEAVVATGDQYELFDAKLSLDRLRRGEGVVHGVV
jgi:HEAT repeat protein